MNSAIEPKLCEITVFAAPAFPLIGDRSSKPRPIVIETAVPSDGLIVASGEFVPELLTLTWPPIGPAATPMLVLPPP